MKCLVKTSFALLVSVILCFGPVSISLNPVQAGIIITRVAPSGIDTFDCGSIQTPCRTIQFAVDKAPSGDLILVAGGTYTYSGNYLSSTCYATTIKPSVVCIIDKHLTFVGGYSTNNWNISDPASNPTIIDGENSNRGISLIGSSPTSARASLSMEGFTIRNGLAQGAISGADWQIGGYGGGVSAVNAALTLRNMELINNKAVGGNTNISYGGVGAGGGLAISQTPPGETAILENVNFEGNEARGGQGNNRGGSSHGGGIYTWAANVEATNSTFKNNVAQAGSSNGVGYDSTGQNADGLGGGACFHGDGIITFQDLTAVENYAIGGNAGHQAGHGHGGGLFTEIAASVKIIDADIRDNWAIGGNGEIGGIGGGGGIMSANSNLVLDRILLSSNDARGGDGSELKGPSGGGGLYATRFVGNSTISIANSVISDNYIQMGSGPGNPVGGGGGLWLQGVQVEMGYTTIANNQMQPALVYGIAMALVNFSTPAATIVNSSNCAITDHINNHSSPWTIQAAVHVWNGGNTINFNRGLFANNTNDTNLEDDPITPGGPGNIIGLETMLSSQTAGFISPGSPHFNYHIALDSPLKNKAWASQTLLDRDSQNRPYSNSPDIGSDEYHPFSLSVIPADTSLYLNWERDASLINGGVSRYEILVSCEEGANQPNEGRCGEPIYAGQSTSFSLTGLSINAQYSMTIYAIGDMETKVATSITATTSTEFPADHRLFLPINYN